MPSGYLSRVSRKQSIQRTYINRLASLRGLESRPTVGIVWGSHQIVWERKGDKPIEARLESANQEIGNPDK